MHRGGDGGMDKMRGSAGCGRTQLVVVIQSGLVGGSYSAIAQSGLGTRLRRQRRKARQEQGTWLPPSYSMFCVPSA